MSITVYIVRHGEVEHHRMDVTLTGRGREQAARAGEALAARVADGDVVRVHHSPVTRVRETAELLLGELTSRLVADGRAPWVELHPLQPDAALQNVRFILEPGQEPEEPSLLYDQITDPRNADRFPPTQADFYRGFWVSRDPMGHWLSHDSGGGAETPETVLERLRARLADILNGAAAAPGRTHWIMLTHSGTMRVLLRDVLGTDPGEPDFCEIVALEPSAVPGQATLAYRGQTVTTSIAVTG